MAPPADASLPASHLRRLRDIWRSAGWPCRDAIEIELLAGGWLARRLDGDGRETLHLSAAGVELLAATLARNRAAFDAHEALVARVAAEMQRGGRVAWRGLALRAPLPPGPSVPPVPPVPLQSPLAPLPTASLASAPGDDGREPQRAAGPTRWVMCRPDVYSIRHTTVEDYAEPAVHEIKVRRADLLADLRRPDKGAAYRALASQCWYVLAPGIAEPDEVPPEYGVLVADGAGRLELARPAPRRALRVPFAVWMALARANAEPAAEDDGQDGLGAPPA